MTTTTPSSTSTTLLYLLAILLPFVSVFLTSGFSATLLINIALCCLAWIPGIIHAWYVVARNERERKRGARMGLAGNGQPMAGKEESGLPAKEVAV